MRVTCIFTGTKISPSLLPRQRPNRYTFRAGQNLPDKEFRYLRTVIVTAAVYWGFNSMLSHFLLTFQHRAGVSIYTSAFALADACVCGKQSLGPLFCHPSPLHALLHFTYAGLSFSRSYGYILPSSLTRVFPRTLEFSSCLPVSVSVRVPESSLEAFLDSLVPAPSLLSPEAPHRISAFWETDLPVSRPTCLDVLFQSHARLPSCVTPSLKRPQPVQEFQPVVHLLRVSASD